MLPIDAATRDLLMTNTIYREIILRFPDEDFEITGENIVSESFELAQSICDGKDFKLGGGVIGKMQIKVFDVSRNLVGLRVRVFLRVTYMQSGGLLPSSALTPAPTLIPGRQIATAEYPLFSGKIYRSVRSNRSTVRELTAYDKIYELSKSTFYADALTSMLDHRFGTDSVRLDSFVLAVLRTQFYDEEILLDPTARFSYNYLLLLDRPSIYAVAGNGVNALKFVQAYAEAEAGFLVCTADGSLKVKSLSELIPDSTTTRKRSVDETIRYYRELRFEEYVVQPISYAQFKYLNNKTYLYGYSKAYSWYTSDNNNAETGFLSLFDAATLSAISARSISTFTFGDTEAHYISRRCYLPSYGNMFLTVPTALEPDTSYLWGLSDWKKTFSTNQMRIATNSSDSAVNWWLRSPNSAVAFYITHSTGNNNVNNASSTSEVRPALNVAPATVVSDEGADTIYLLPTERAQTVEFKGKLGETNQRPTFGCAHVFGTNLTNVVVQATNNYGDTVPVWQTVQNGVQFEFTNETKETENWQVGIRCYGEAANLSQGYFEQPQMLIEVE